MINVRLLSHNSETEFKNKAEFDTYLEELISDIRKKGICSMRWSHHFWKVEDKTQLLGENDIILFIYGDYIRAKGVVLYQEMIDNGKYKSEVFFSELNQTPLIKVSVFSQKYKIKYVHGEASLQIKDVQAFNKYITEFNKEEEKVIE